MTLTEPITSSNSIEVKAHAPHQSNAGFLSGTSSYVGAATPRSSARLPFLTYRQLAPPDH